MDPVKIKNFDHACILVKDLDRSLRFYCDTLGLEVSRTRTVEGKYPETALGIKNIKLTYVKLQCPSQPANRPPDLELHCWKRPKMLPKKAYNHISFEVRGMDRFYGRMKKRGVRFISPPVSAPHGYSKVCFARDPDGNLIEFTERLR